MKQIIRLIKIFLLWITVGIASKIVFLAVHHSLYSEASASDILGVFIHGVRLDAAIAGYLSIIPGLLLILATWIKERRIQQKVWTCYYFIFGSIISLAFISNIALYGFWGFPLDSTPLLYLKTSPGDAFASATFGMIAGGILAEALFTAGIGYYFKRFAKLPSVTGKLGTKFLNTIGLLFGIAILFIPIRGGFGTGTNHTGSVYFSSNTRINHAAVNPVFCFIESVLHMEDFGDKYKFMDDAKAEELFKGLSYTELRSDSIEYLNKQKDVNIILIMLESFSKYIMPEGGHVDGVTPNLDKLTHEGLYFSNFYASSFRTDRAIVTILSGFPAQPTMSLMDMPKKTNGLYSIARSLGRKGYETTFYYGGDTNYSNMKSYIVGTGFQQVVSESDFPSKLRTSKWGVHDEHVFKKVTDDIASASTHPYFKAIMTLSSHEPFDVPYKSGFENEALNSFAYTDNCLGGFISGLKKTNDWEKTLVVIVPDHLGAYPENVDNFQLWRYQIPLVMVGGVVEQPRIIEECGCQTDIAATLLGLLGVDHSEFIYSKDILDKNASHYALFDFPDAFGMVRDSSHVIYDMTMNKTVVSEGKDTEELSITGKAFIQKLHEDINKR